MQERVLKIGVACGGTGGHLYPGFATAEALRARGHEVSIWLGGHGAEARAGVGWHGMIRHVPVRSGSGTGSRLASAFGFLRGFVLARRLVRRDGLDVMLAMGSYTSICPALGARAAGVSVVLHEANAIPGRAVRFLSRAADAVALGFEDAGRYLPRARGAVLTGFPVRKELVGLQRLTSGDRLRLMVMGGSLGAAHLNETVPAALAALGHRVSAVEVLHLTGVGKAASVREAYASAGVTHDVLEFLDDMRRAYAWADVAVTRSGAATCAELAVCGVPAVLVPYPFAVRDHQTANARALVAAGAADLCVQREFTSRWLCDYITQCLERPGKLADMRAALQRVAVPDATDRLCDLVERIGGT